MDEIEKELAEALGVKKIINGKRVVNVHSHQCAVESNLSRVKHHLDNGSIAISASRDENSPEENQGKSAKLRQDIRNLGYGYVVLVGGYNEEGVDVVESSFLVPYVPSKGSFEDFVRIFHKLANKYDQDSILVTEPISKIYYLGKDGETRSEFTKTKFDVDKAKYFSMLAKGNHRNRKWVFEGIAVPDTLFGKHRASLEGMLHFV